MDPDMEQSPEEPVADEVAELKEKLARARADYVNLENRVARDAALERERVKARVLEGFLQVFEYAKMAESAAESSPGPLADGVSMMVREFQRVLEGEGVQWFGAEGDAFDNKLHEAVSAEPADEDGTGKIVRVVAPGYRLGERVLRYAKVVVGE